jgi:hypothetical protein
LCETIGPKDVLIYSCTLGEMTLLFYVPKDEAKGFLDEMEAQLLIRWFRLGLIPKKE